MYVILEQGRERGADEGTVWREVGTVEATSAATAVGNYVKSGKSSGGVFLAIPERSAKTIRVKVETVQKVSVDAGDDA